MTSSTLPAYIPFRVRKGMFRPVLEPVGCVARSCTVRLHLQRGWLVWCDAAIYSGSSSKPVEDDMCAAMGGTQVASAILLVLSGVCLILRLCICCVGSCGCCTHMVLARQPQYHKSKWAQRPDRDVFLAIGSSHLWCRGSQPKYVSNRAIVIEV